MSVACSFTTRDASNACLVKNGALVDTVAGAGAASSPYQDIHRCRKQQRRYRGAFRSSLKYGYASLKPAFTVAQTIQYSARVNTLMTQLGQKHILMKIFYSTEDIALANTGPHQQLAGLMFVKTCRGAGGQHRVAEMWDDIPWNTFEQVELGPDDFMNEEEGCDETAATIRTTAICHLAGSKANNCTQRTRVAFAAPVQQRRAGRLLSARLYRGTWKR